MVKKTISSLELAALVPELQFLVSGRIDQIYQQEHELLFQIYVPGEGKRLLRLVPGKFCCLTTRKETVLNPSSFSMQLRKYLDHAFIQTIYQQDSERILVLEVETKNKFFLITELFSKGNVVLTDAEFKIIAVLEQQSWKDRMVKPGVKYLFPHSFDWKTLTLPALKKILERSTKRNLATALATELGLGGIYAEEVCHQAQVDKEKVPAAITVSDQKNILAALQGIQRQLKSASGFIYAEQITPFPLSGEKELKKTTTYSEAIDTLKSSELVSPYEKKIAQLTRMKEQQEAACGSLQEEITVNTQKADLIYTKYSPLQKLLSIVKELRKTKSWSEVETELKREKNIRKIDLKNKKVIIGL